MPSRSVLMGISILAVAFALSGCGPLGGNSTQGIAVASKNCLQDSSKNTPPCLPRSDLTIAPNVPVWETKAAVVGTRACQRRQHLIATTRLARRRRNVC